METPLCDFGWKAPNFTLHDLDGKSVTMTDYLGEKGLLVAFICNHCPYVKTIIEKFVTDAKILQAEGINILAIMSNDYHAYPDDAPDKMRLFAEENGFTFPYLIDEDQSVARAYDAICTPDFFGLNQEGTLQYRGRFDNIGMRHTDDSRIPELLEAMQQIAKTGSGPKAQTASMGCSIKWK